MSAVSCRPAPHARSAALAALMMLALLAGCGGGAETPPPSMSASGGSASTMPSTDPTTTQPTDPGTPPTGQTAMPTDELPYDPIQRTVTGVVARPGGCTVLEVGTSRFVLIGDLAATLTIGSRMTVTGNLTHRPPSCPGVEGQEMQVTNVVPA